VESGSASPLNAIHSAATTLNKENLLSSCITAKEPPRISLWYLENDHILSSACEYESESSKKEESIQKKWPSNFWALCGVGGGGLCRGIKSGKINNSAFDVRRVADKGCISLSFRRGVTIHFL
jgi:hypothetical protein